MGQERWSSGQLETGSWLVGCSHSCGIVQEFIRVVTAEVESEDIEVKVEIHEGSVLIFFLGADIEF